MTIHELKTWPPYFQAILNKKKTFEIRKNDRGFKEGDNLLLREWNPHTEKYTGRKASVMVTYLMGDNYAGLNTDYCAMSIEMIPFPWTEEPK